jgi:hypothetical protein
MKVGETTAEDEGMRRSENFPQVIFMSSNAATGMSTNSEDNVAVNTGWEVKSKPKSIVFWPK